MSALRSAFAEQLLNHTSGICPEAIAVPNDGTWEYILGHSGDPRTAKLAFDPGTACGYPQVFSHGWELPARMTGEGGRSGEGLPKDARSKPGSGGQLIAFVPSLDLVITRQTGSSGEWQFEEYLRRACAAVLPK